MQPSPVQLRALQVSPQALQSIHPHQHPHPHPHSHTHPLQPSAETALFRPLPHPPPHPHPHSHSHQHPHQHAPPLSHLHSIQHASDTVFAPAFTSQQHTLTVGVPYDAAPYTGFVQPAPPYPLPAVAASPRFGINAPSPVQQGMQGPAMQHLDAPQTAVRGRMGKGVVQVASSGARQRSERVGVGVESVHSPLPPPPLALPVALAAPGPAPTLSTGSPTEAGGVDDMPSAHHAQFHGLKLIPNPPDLETWRQRLFDVSTPLTLTRSEFQTYFPHVDNVYSHRSTQKHKRKRFVSHYWDCRLKGRPPGTKKSTDPEKKKRKRVARERDLCDVKIKITEWWDSIEYEEVMGVKPPAGGNGVVEGDGRGEGRSPLLSIAPGPAPQDTRQNGTGTGTVTEFFGAHQMFSQQHCSPTSWALSPSLQQVSQIPLAPSLYAPTPASIPAQSSPIDPAPPLQQQRHPSPPQQPKFYTVQRVNGNGGNGKGDGVPGPHKHTLMESDRVKKNSVERWLTSKERAGAGRKSVGGDPTKKTYHKKATGAALATVKDHLKDEDIKLYGSCFCPFVQRVWISLEHHALPYTYIEVDPYRKPPSLLSINPRGLVPALRHGPTWSTHESTVILEYLEDITSSSTHAGTGDRALLPADPQKKADVRLWCDHVNRKLIPAFYKILQAQQTADQAAAAQELSSHIATLTTAAHTLGPFFLGPSPCLVDVSLVPWVLRLSRVLGPYRGWPAPEERSRWASWVEALEGWESVRKTTSGAQLYLDSYERYAENRPGVSEVADAINEGRGLP